MKTAARGRGTLTMAALVLLPFAAHGESPPLKMVDVYRDLPGVETPVVSEARRPVTCEQVVVESRDPFPPTNGRRYTTVYQCTKDGITFESSNPPPSLDRQKRGLNW